MESTIFLLRDEVLRIHQKQIDRFGGTHGMHDAGLLESALAMPIMGFGDHVMHTTLNHMSAAYIYHIIKNHPFLDGNKRTGVVSGLVFLKLNGVAIPWRKNEMVYLAESIATNVMSKQEVANYLEELARRRKDNKQSLSL